MLTVCDKQPLSLGLTTNLNFRLAFEGPFHPFTMAASSWSLYFIPCGIFHTFFYIKVKIIETKHSAGSTCLLLWLYFLRCWLHMAVQTYHYSRCVAEKGKGRVWHCKPALTVSNLIGFSSAWQQLNITEDSSRVQHTNQCRAGTRLETWYIEWYWSWYQRTNQTHMTWGNTRLLQVPAWQGPEVLPVQ